MPTRKAPAPGVPSRRPLYAGVKQALLARLRDAVWRPGDRLPAEPVLAAEFDVSIGTLRRAVSELVDEGTLLRIQGSGTYVKGLAGRYWNRFQPFQTRDGTPLFLTERIPLSFEALPAGERLSKHLCLSEASPVIRIVRLMKIGERFCGIDELFLPAELFRGLSLDFFRSQLRSEESLYAFYERKFGVSVVSTTNRVRMKLAGRDLAEKCRDPQLEGKPLLEVSRIARTYGHVPVEYRVSCADASLVQISFDL